MSFALSTPDVEWGSRDLGGMFAQPGCLRSPRFMRMWFEIVRFSKNAGEVLDEAQAAEWEGATLGDYLTKRGYSDYFAQHYVIPMCAAIWSCSDADALAWPVRSLVRFWKNHHLLDLIERPVWRVLKGRSRAYVDAVVAALDDVRVSSAVQSVKRLPGGGIEVTVAGKSPEKFDHVVLATHSDVTLKLLGESATKEERTALGDIAYQPNDIYLHTDQALMPRNRKAWASWNCLKRDTSDTTSSVCVSYWVNLLQNLPEGCRDVFVTLNPPKPPEASSILKKLSLAHPLLNLPALAAQKKLSTGELQGVGNVWFAGAWCGYGFHEDGIKSAVEMANRLCGVKSVVPWDPVACNPKLTLVQKGFLRLFKKYGSAILADGTAVRLVLPDGSEAYIGNKEAKPADLTTVHVRDGELFSKAVLRSDIGLGEAYMDGSFDTDDLYHMIEVLSRNSCSDEARDEGLASMGLIGNVLFRISEAMELAAHRANSNTEEGSKRNISYHYDAGNDFYKLFLDNTLMYSSAIHPGLLGPLEGLNFEEKEKLLEEAQYKKLDAMIERAELKPGEHVLEIGCGWGTCALRMAKKAGVRVTGITVSNEQLIEAKAKVAAAGLSDRINIVFCDYRRVHELPTYPVGGFDKVVSIEMLEAVGHEHLNSYFECVERYLKPGGLAAVQVITLPDDRYKAYCEQHSDFIRRYIFPGGHLPSLGVMTSVSSRHGLELTGCSDLGPDYAVTLRLWRERMLARTDQVLALGYPMRFIRMYEFYFAYCEAGFANGLIHDYQIGWRKSHLRAAKSASAISAGAAAAAAKAGPPLDPLTTMCLLVWTGLVIALCVAKVHMAVIGFTCAGFVMLKWALASKYLGGFPLNSASSLTALVAAVSLTCGSLMLMHAAVTSASAAPAAAAAASSFSWWSSLSQPAASPHGFWPTLCALILSPSTPQALLPGARAVVGTAAGFATLRAWECVRDPRQRSVWEAIGYAVSLVCTSAALYHDTFLLGLAPAQLCEAHTLLLRLRALRNQAGKPPSEALWAASWVAYVLLRLLPHLGLLALFTLTPGLPRSARLAVLGLVQINIHNLAIGWSMLRAQTTEARTLELEELAAAQHRDGSSADASSTATAASSASKATSPPLNLGWALCSACAAAACAFLTLQQEPDSIRIIVSTTAAYAALYTLLRATGLLQPRAGKITPAEMAEWRSRLCSTLNAIVLVVGSLMCFSEWPYTPASEGWISNHLWSNPVTFASIFVGYLQWDVCWVIYHQASTPDAASAIHHSLFIAITHYVLWGWYFKQPYAWLSLAELSTPFLNGRWFLAVLGRKSGSLYMGVSLIFAATFLLTRVVGYILGIADIWQCYELWKEAKWGLYAVIAGCHAGLLLNLFWSRAVVGALVRAFKGKQA